MNPFNLIPPCLTDPDTQTSLRACLLGSGAGGVTVVGVLTYWINILFIFAAMISFFYILYGALHLLTAFGNEAKYTQGKNTVLYAVIGLIVAVLASLIVSAATDLFSGHGP